MGRLDDEHLRELCLGGPISLAERDPNKVVNLWLPESLIAEAKELFDGHDNIQLYSIDRLLNLEYVRFNHLSEESIIRTRNVIEGLEKINKYSAQVDLLEVLIIAEFGGFYFDTTTYFYDYPDTTIDKIKIFLPDYAVRGEAEYPVYASDYWAYAALNPGQKFFIDVFIASLESYENNLENMVGCNDSDIIIDHYGFKPTIEDLENISWSTELITDMDFMHVKQLNMFKFHPGSWRPQFVPENMNLQQCKNNGLSYVKLLILIEKAENELNSTQPHSPFWESNEQLPLKIKLKCLKSLKSFVFGSLKKPRSFSKDTPDPDLVNHFPEIDEIRSFIEYAIESGVINASNVDEYINDLLNKANKSSYSN